MNLLLLQAATVIFERAFDTLNLEVTKGFAIKKAIKDHKHEMAEGEEARLKAESDNYTIQLIPASVMLAFSIELKFKLLIFHESGLEIKNRQGHDLDYLFSKLSTNSQTIIRESVKQELAQRKEVIDDAQFLNALKVNKDTFMDWRYFYEGKNLQVTYNFLQSLHNAAKNLSLLVMISLNSSHNSGSEPGS